MKKKSLLLSTVLISTTLLAGQVAADETEVTLMLASKQAFYQAKRQHHQLQKQAHRQRKSRKLQLSLQTKNRKKLQQLQQRTQAQLTISQKSQDQQVRQIQMTLSLSFILMTCMGVSLRKALSSGHPSQQKRSRKAEVKERLWCLTQVTLSKDCRFQIAPRVRTWRRS